MKSINEFNIGLAVRSEFKEIIHRMGKQKEGVSQIMRV